MKHHLYIMVDGSWFYEWELVKAPRKAEISKVLREYSPEWWKHHQELDRNGYDAYLDSLGAPL